MMSNHLTAWRLAAWKRFLILIGIINLVACNQFSTKDKHQPDTTVPAAEISTQIPEQPVADTPPLIIQKTLWEELTTGYGLPQVEDEKVSKYLRWYSNNQRYLDKVTQQSTPYLFYVKNQLQAHNMPLELALLPIVESAYNPMAVSSSKAVGIWQFVPRTGRNFGLQQNSWYDGRRDLVASTDAAIRYLKRLHTMFDGDWFLAIAAYNAGEGSVGRAIKRNKRNGKPTDFWSLPLSKQTQSYVPQLLAISKIIANPQKYELTLTEIPNTPYFTSINLNSPIDLAQAARMANMDPQQLRMLNAGYSKWITATKGPYELLVPVADAAAFTLALDKMPKLAPIKTDSFYKVKSGDTLGAIAYKFGSNVKAIQKINGMTSTRLRIGQELLIPGDEVWVSEYADMAEQEAAARNSHKVIMTHYTVKPGDNLWTISRKQNVKLASLMQWNNLSKSSKLKPGQKLVVSQQISYDPKDNKITYQIQPGDTLHTIANRFDVTKKELLNWNKVKNESYIHPGQELTIYVTAKN